MHPACLLFADSLSYWVHCVTGTHDGVSFACRRSHVRSMLALQAGQVMITHGLLQVVFLGLHAILGMLTRQPALLNYPPVASAYFVLLLQVCELYPAAVARLPPSHFQPLMTSLQWGLGQAAADVVVPSLQAAGELASWHYRARIAGEPGLTAAATQGESPPGIHVAP